MLSQDIGSQRRQNQPFVEDDHTFLPPALSSYSIALLNDRTEVKPKKEVTGIYELDFPESNSKLKQKLASHFKSNMIDIHSDRSATPEVQLKSSNSNHNSYTNPLIPMDDKHTTSRHSSFSGRDLDENNNPSQNDHSSHSNHSIDSHLSRVSQHSSQFSNPLNFQKTLLPRPLSSSGDVDRIMPPVKKLRGPKRFGKLLGPPQRVRAPIVETAKDFDLSFVDKDKELELRKRIEEQKLLNELERKAKRESIRKPLEEIPPSNTPNAFDGNMFRKPKLPKQNEDVPVDSKENAPVEHVKKDVALPPAILQSIQARKPEKVEKPPPKDENKKKTIIINNNQYEKLELLGRGGTSKVYKVKCTSDNRLYAIKKVTFDQFDDVCVKGFKGEIDLLLKLKQNPRVVQLVDHAIGEGLIYLVMECGEIDLSHVLHNRLNVQGEMDLNFVKFYATELLKCVQTVHKAEIVHSDLKPANFLFVKGVLKIIDFGIANAVPDHTANIYRDAQIGTPNYMAPEALVDVNDSLLPMKQLSAEQKNTWRVGKPSDIWSCGCIIYQMIYGKPPYGKYSGSHRIMAIMNPQVKILYPSKGIGGVKVPHSAIELMQNCLSRFPPDRWTVEQCLASDFLCPKVVSENFVRDLVHLAVNFGYNNRVNGTGIITADVYDKLVETVMKQIDELHYS